MGSSSSSSYSFSISFLKLTLTLLTLSLTLSPTSSKSHTPDYTTFVYKGCNQQPLTDPSALSALFTSLIQQASRTKFFKTTSSSTSSGSITGLFQCRGDLSAADCSNCVAMLPQMADRMCGKVAAARVQTLGCYMLYEPTGFAQISGMKLLYKDCSRTNVAGAGFEMRRDTALQVMQNGVGSGNGFYATNYQSVFVLGQCEGDLGSVDCGQCVKSAVEKAQVECGGSIAAQVYLHKCFISYAYYPNGVPSGGGGGYSGGYSSGGYSSGSVHNTGKTVAIIVGGTACVGFLVICVLFVRGLKKKDDDY